MNIRARTPRNVLRSSACMQQRRSSQHKSLASDSSNVNIELSRAGVYTPFTMYATSEETSRYGHQLGAWIDVTINCILMQVWDRSNGNQWMCGCSTTVRSRWISDLLALNRGLFVPTHSLTATGAGSLHHYAIVAAHVP